MAKRRQIFVDEAAGEELLLPVTPSSYQWDSGIKINTVTLDGLGDLHFPGRTALAAEDIECFFPARAYPFNEPGTVLDPTHYLVWLEKRCQAGTVLRYIVSGTSINSAVILESIRASESDGTNDVHARISLRQYVAPQTLAVTVEQTAVRDESGAAVEERVHTVAAGDTLWALCRKYYGTTSLELCRRVGAYNGIKNIHLIYVGDIIRFPTLDGLPLTGVAESPSQAAVAGTSIESGEDGLPQLVTEPQPIEIALSMAGQAQYYGTAKLEYTDARTALADAKTIGPGYPRITVSTRPGDRIRVTWSAGGSGGKYDHLTIDGARAKGLDGALVRWPTKSIAITVHWKGGG